ncbi:MAG: hypothetical protein ACOX9A_04565 [Anaerolineae bacterium]|jgi:hypothetical protein
METDARSVALEKFKILIQRSGGYWSSNTEKVVGEMIDGLVSAVMVRMAGPGEQAEAVRKSIAKLVK